MPLASLGDSELKAGLPYTNALELPRSITGSFASVYRMHCKNKDFALRLFLSNIRDQHERYALISDFVQHDDLPYTVTFDFLTQGIKIHGEWLPALKMDWLEGEQLDDYIVENLANPNKLGQLLEKFVKMMQEMRRAGIAHGDLQHGNILVCKDELRLVDYDGMFVPAMKDFTANELGHRNYQHPDRAAHHFGPYLDNFSAWIIYASLYALQIDSRLMHQLGGGDDCLLFRQSDFLDPLHSSAFAALEKHSDTRLRDLGKFVRVQLKTDLQNIPYLTLPLPQGLDKDLHPVSASAPVVKSGARLVRGNLPDWLQEKNAEVLANTKLGYLNDVGGSASQQTTSNSTSGATPNAVHSWTVPAKPAQNAAWFKPGMAAANASKAPGPSKLNKIASSINAAAQQKQQQLTFAQQRMQQMNAPRPLTVLQQQQLPIELTHTNVPRKVQWNPNCGRINPQHLLYLMVLNPLVWAMFSFSSHATGFDAQLAAKGVMVPATVTKVEVDPRSSARSRIDYEYKYKGRSYFGSEERSPNAKVFEKGDGYSIGILPSNPFVTEAINAPLGTRRHCDELFALIFGLANLSLVAAIYWAPSKQRKLIASGTPLVANIDLLRMHTGVTNTVDVTPGEMWFKADISFVLNGADIYKTINVTESEYFSLKTSTSEVILCDPNTTEVTFYRFSRYHAVAPSRNTNRP